MELRKNLLRIIFVIILLNIGNYAFSSTKNKIILSVEDQIISSYELKNKIKTILFFSGQQLEQTNIDRSKKLALKQLIDYKLKKNQVIRFNIQNDNSNKTLEYLKNLSLKYQTDINGLKIIFKDNDLDYDMYLDEMNTEFNWQALIFNKFKDQIIIDEKEIDIELNNFIESQEDLEEYKLAEIEIPLKNNSDDRKTILEINDQIKLIGFKDAAIKYSMSSSSLSGGDIGWISSKSLSEEILSIINKMKINDISKPIIQTNTATIIKLIDKKTSNISDINLDQLKQQIIKNKKNNLLNLYSNNYLSKIKNNALIEIK